MNKQRGGFGMGLIVGLLAGLAVALAVALYVTKVPVPFINKVPQRTAEQDAAEAEKNKNWDPNSPLYGKNPAKAAAVAPPPSAPAADPSATSPATSPAAPPTAAATNPAPAAAGIAPPPVAASAAAPKRVASAPGSTRDPAAILADRPSANAPAGDGGTGLSTQAAVDPFRYFVQAGAYSQTDEAEQQRARLGMLGFVARVTEREQSGRTVYRVRLGPYEKKDDADTAKERLEGAGVEAALVRVQK